MNHHIRSSLPCLGDAQLGIVQGMVEQQGRIALKKRSDQVDSAQPRSTGVERRTVHEDQLGWVLLKERCRRVIQQITRWRVVACEDQATCTSPLPPQSTRAL